MFFGIGLKGVLKNNNFKLDQDYGNHGCYGVNSYGYAFAHMDK